MQQQDGDQQVEVGRGRRGDRDNPKDVLQQQDGDQQVDVLLLLDALVPSLVAPVLDLVGPGLLREIEEERVLVEGSTELTVGIAPEKTLGGTTGDSGQSRAQLGWAST